MYDYGARYYDPVLGRWHSQDPLVAFASPYNGIGNNPVNMIDRWGMCPGAAPEGNGCSSGSEYSSGGNSYCSTWSMFWENGTPNYFYAGGKSYSSGEYQDLSCEATRNGYTQNMSNDDAVRRVIWENRYNESSSKTGVIHHPSEKVIRDLYADKLDDMKLKKFLSIIAKSSSGGSGLLALGPGDTDPNTATDAEPLIPGPYNSSWENLGYQIRELEYHIGTDGNCKGGTAPAPIKFIANLNPLVSIPSGVKTIFSGSDIYNQPVESRYTLGTWMIISGFNNMSNISPQSILIDEEVKGVLEEFDAQ